jgi:hypothetical protein
VPHFAGAEASNVLPGLAVVVYGNEDGIESDWRAAPMTDIAELRLTLDGLNGTPLDADPEMVMSAGGNDVRMKRPAIYEEFPCHGDPSGRRSAP